MASPVQRLRHNFETSEFVTYEFSFDKQKSPMVLKWLVLHKTKGKIWRLQTSSFINFQATVLVEQSQLGCATLLFAFALLDTVG